jgi:hypothetical protein
MRRSIANMHLRSKGIDTADQLEHTSVENELLTLQADSLNILKEELQSDDPHRRLQAAVVIMQLNNKPAY